MARQSAADEVSGLWLATLERAIGRASHDVKDALNGVSVNLEVVRSRAHRPETPASAVAQFADAAGQQLVRFTTLIDTVLALGRAEREPVDVGLVLWRLATLCSASATSADASVEVRQGGDESALTRLPGAAVRLAIAGPLLDVIAGTDRQHPVSTVTCELGLDATSVRVTIAADGRRAAMPDGLAGALRAAGVQWADPARDEHFSLAFPRA